MKNTYVKKALMVIAGILLFVAVTNAMSGDNTLTNMENSTSSSLESQKAAREVKDKAIEAFAQADNTYCLNRKALAAYKMTLPQFAGDKDRLEKVVEDCTF